MSATEHRGAREAGHHAAEIVLPGTASEAGAGLAVWRRLNDDPAIHGFLVQFPPQVRQKGGDRRHDSGRRRMVSLAHAGLLVSGPRGFVRAPAGR